jgi:hypothetical protein
MPFFERPGLATTVENLMDEHVLFQSGNLVFDVQFLTFQFRNVEVVDRRVGKSFCDFLFKRLVPFFKFRKMRFNRHVACLLADGQFRSFLHPDNRPRGYSDFAFSKIPAGGVVVDLWAIDQNAIIARHLGAIRSKTRRLVGRKTVLFRLGATRAVMTQEEERELRAELARLQQEHRDLDAAIAALQDSPGSDLIQVQRLKKRKLLLRDRITFIEDQLTPDIIA